MGVCDGTFDGWVLVRLGVGNSVLASGFPAFSGSLVAGRELGIRNGE